MAPYLFIMHPQLYQNTTSLLRAAGKQYPNPLTSTYGQTATNLKFTNILRQQMHKPRICVEPNALGGASCYDPPQFFSSIPVTPATAPPPAAPAPVAPPAIQPIPVQPVAPPQPYIRIQLPLPIQVDPANVPLPTSSTDSDMSLPDQPMPASPRTHTFVEHLQGQIVHQATTRERGRITTRALQDLHNALADMFGLPLLSIPQSSPARSPSPMAAISISQSCHNESHHLSSAPSIPATRPHSQEPEPGPSKQPITWDLKDPAHPLHQWGMQQAYKEHIKQAGYNYPVPCLPSVKSGSQPASPASPQETSPQQSTSPHSETTGLCSPDLESIPEEEEAAPLGGHHQLPTMPGGIHQDL